MSYRALVFVCVTAALLTACADTVREGPPDATRSDGAGATLDASRDATPESPDVPAATDLTVDATPTHQAPTDVTPTDEPAPLDAASDPADFCGDDLILDANVDGFPSGLGTDLAFHWTQLRPGATTPASASCGGRGVASHRLVVRYTPRARSHLAMNAFFDDDVSLPDAQPDRALLLDGCRPGARVIACSGRSANGNSNELGNLETLRSSELLPPGRPVYVVIAAPPRSGRLRFFEVTTVVPLDAPCAVDAAYSVCADGARCAPYAGSGRCRADGTVEGYCRSEGAPCDPGLSCARPDDSPRGVCLHARRHGEQCADGRGLFCVDGICTADGQPGMVARCVGNGTSGGRCRGVAPRCDDELSCLDRAGSPGVCGRTLPSGALCFVAGGLPCVVGERCVVDGATARCVLDGSEGVPCRDRAPRCADGFLCGRSPLDSPVCTRPGDVGAPCATPGPACAAGAICRRGEDGASRCAPLADRGGRCATFADCESGLLCDRGVCAPLTCATAPCAADGALGDHCRPRSPRCDGDLVCDRTNRCATPRARPGAGEACPGGVCAGGLVCGTTCQENGGHGAWCRLGANPCNDGFQCSEPDYTRGTFPRCLRPATTGALCPESGICESGSVCDGTTDGTNRCVALADVHWCDALASDPDVPCPTGTRCAQDRCRHVAAPIERCGGLTVCPAGSSCVQERCVADGQLLGRCLADVCAGALRCRAFDPLRQDPRCYEEIADGAPCLGVAAGRVCAEQSTCTSTGCAARGGARRPCRSVERACDAGLTCDGTLCLPPGVAGARCNGAEDVTCPPPLVCLSDATTSRCDAGSYRVELRPDDPFVDPCTMPRVAWGSGLAFRVLGVDFDVLEAPGGSIRVTPRLGEYLRSLSAPGLSPSGCVRVFGSPPSRRVVSAESVAGDGWAVTFFEGSSAVELHYRGVRPGYPERSPWTSVGFSVGPTNVLARGVRVTPGTTLRFTAP